MAVLVQTSTGSGSGFYIDDTSHSLYFVTACHVLVNPQTKIPYSDLILLISYKKNSQTDGKDSFQISLSQATKMGQFKYDVQKDIAVIKFATSNNRRISYLPFVYKITSTNTYLNQFSLSEAKKIDELVTMTDIFTIGFPKSLSLTLNFDYSRPLIRKGIIAGIDLITNKIIADCPVYQGNSGGAVYEIGIRDNVLKIIGVVSQFVPFEEHLRSEAYGYTNINITNSGYAVIVPINSVIDLIQSLKK